MEHCAVRYHLFISNAHALKFPFQNSYKTLQTHAHHPVQINHVLSTLSAQNKKPILKSHSSLGGDIALTVWQPDHNFLALLVPDLMQSVACGNIMKCGLRQMKARQCVCRAETHARDLRTAANKPGSCSVVLSNLPCGSSGLYFFSAYL